ncbi:Hypothetical predicted protein, partial [Paramuricea clavata]
CIIKFLTFLLLNRSFYRRSAYSSLGTLSFMLTTHVTQPTHIHGRTLDLIITRKRESLISILIVKPVIKEGDQRKRFRATKALLLPKSDLCFPDYHINTALANYIGNYFHRKAANIRKELDVFHVTHEERAMVIDDPELNAEHEKLSNFKELTQENVNQLIRAFN